MYLYICIYIFIDINIHIGIYTCTCTYIYIYMYMLGLPPSTLAIELFYSETSTPPSDQLLECVHVSPL